MILVTNEESEDDVTEYEEKLKINNQIKIIADSIMSVVQYLCLKCMEPISNRE